MHAVVAEPLAHGAAGEGRQELQRRRVGRRGGDHDGVVEGSALFERLDDLGDGGTLLADGHVDAEEFGLVVGAGVDLLLVQDGVDGDGGLAGLAIADDQFALAAADRHQGVDDLEPGLDRFMHRLAGDDARRLDVHAALLRDIDDGTLAVNRLAQRIDDAAEQSLAHGNVHDLAQAADFVAFGDLGVGAENHDADVVALEIQGHALHPGGRELDHFAGLDLIEAEHAGDAVADRQHLADVGDVRLDAEIGDLTLEDVRDFSGANVHGGCS